jgi:hypothetical protein
MAVADRTIARSRRVAQPTWARTFAASGLAVLAGPVAAAAVLLIIWSLLHAVGVTPSQSLGETALLDTLPGSNIGWEVVGSVVFAALVLVDAAVRARCIRGIVGMRLSTGWLVLSVLVAPGAWAWLDDRREALPILLASTVMLALLIRVFAGPSTAWRPTRRTWLGFGALALAGLAGLWVAMGAALVADSGESSEVRIVPQGVYATDKPLDYHSLVVGNQKPTVAVFRVTVNNAGLFPIHVTSVKPAVSGGLFRPLQVPARGDLSRGASTTLTARARIKSCWPLPSGQLSSVDAVVVRYTVLGVSRTERVEPDDPLRVVCPVKQA